MGKHTAREPIVRTQFPRFEVDLEPNLPGGSVKPRASFQNWVAPGVMSWMFDLKAVESVRDINEKRFLNWCGVYDEVHERVSPSRLMRLSVDMTERLYRIRVRNHEYLWDGQAIPGRAHELVLEVESKSPGEFDEVAALLTKTLDSDEQRFVLNNNGDWYEPRKEDADMAASYLFCMSTLANLPAK